LKYIIYANKLGVFPPNNDSQRNWLNEALVQKKMYQNATKRFNNALPNPKKWEEYVNEHIDIYRKILPHLEGK
jgi:hypothetical protein